MINQTVSRWLLAAAIAVSFGKLDLAAADSRCAYAQYCSSDLKPTDTAATGLTLQEKMQHENRNMTAGNSTSTLSSNVKTPNPKSGTGAGTQRIVSGRYGDGKLAGVKSVSANEKITVGGARTENVSASPAGSYTYNARNARRQAQKRGRR